MRSLTLSIAACCLLSACASGPQQMQAQSIKPQAAVTTPPQPLPPPRSGAMRDLEANHREVARLYHLLAARYCGLLRELQLDDEQCTPFLAGTGPVER